jgi:type IV secretion system protein VirD4
MSYYGHGYGPHADPFGPAMVSVLLIGGIATTVLFAFWFVTGLSAMLFGDGWPAVSALELGEAVINFPEQIGDPAQAWSPRIARGLAGPVGFYATFAFVVAGATASVISWTPAVRSAAKRTGIRPERAPSARWARRQELRRLVVGAPEPGRVVLGRMGRSLLAAEQRQSVLVVAPSQAHKTSGIAIPALLEWEGPAIVTSVKDDLLADTLARRRALGKVMVYDPTGATPVASAQWSPLGYSGSWYGAQQMAFWLCAMARPPQAATASGDAGDANFWAKAAAKLLGPLLLAAATTGREIADVLRWVETQEEDEVRDALESEGNHDALRAAQASFMREERQRSSIYTTIETVLEAYGDPRVLDSARVAEVSAAALLDGGANTLYICGPAHEQERLAPVFSALLEEMISVASGIAKASKRIDPPLLVVGDELANIAPIRSLPRVASTAASQGIVLLSIFQDLAQAQRAFGRDWATVVNNHRAKLFGTGSGDPATLDYVRRVASDAEYRQRSESYGHGLGRDSKTEATTYRPIAPANVVREAPQGSALLLYGHLPPAKIKLRPWFADRSLRALASAEPVDVDQARCRHEAKGG